MSMNIHMKSVKVTLKGKNPVPMDHLAIRGSTVRYVILPVCSQLCHSFPSRLLGSPSSRYPSHR